MSSSPARPRIPSSYYVYCDPPDKTGEETLHFISAQRRLRLRGRSFREFLQSVVPLLDGTRTVDEVKRAATDLFAPADLDDCLQLLAEHGLLEDATQWALPEEAQARLRPQLNLFQLLSPEPWALQRKLAASRVAILGLSNIGAVAAQSLAAAGVGDLRCIDDERVTPADLYSCGVFDRSAVGTLRTDSVRERLARLAPDTRIETVDTALADDEAVERAVAGSDFILNCLDEGRIATAYKLNRVCVRLGLRWTTAAADSLEVLVGPTVIPRETGCFLCYRMRAVACAANPEAEFDFQSYLDRRRQDDGGRRANLVFGTTIAGQFAGLEALKILSGALQTALRGRLMVVDLRDLGSTLHVVLRKPWCPACFAAWDAGGE